MKGWTGNIAALAVLMTTGVAQAAPATLGTASASALSRIDDGDDGDADALPYLQCVPYAREVSGINLRGDALTWWDQAEGRYARGARPKVGAVMSFRPYAGMHLGHVAAVSRVIDSRTVLLRHANWSPINGRRGQIENDVRAVDVSPENDWSEVRVWYAPIGDLGTTHWPVNGFIYKEKPKKNERLAVLASADPAPARARPAAVPAAPEPSRIDAGFLRGVAIEGQTQPRTAGSPASATRAYLSAPAPRVPATRTVAARPPRDSDPIGRIIAARMR